MQMMAFDYERAVRDRNQRWSKGKGRNNYNYEEIKKAVATPLELDKEGRPRVEGLWQRGAYAMFDRYYEKAR